MKPIIEINHLYKKYKIGERVPYYSLRDTIANFVKSPFRQKNNFKKDEFWALKNISFKVMPGEVVGIIGQNGAGKSTLLKVLSRITPPTQGDITLRGRVASLLEIGTGFNSELTGRENIFLNGAILGMKRAEIKQKFDQIVDFAEIRKFLDTPVKYYSSGMYMRLAFAVAAHLESEILLIDEVLAVGDTEFQQKCFNKMSSLSQSGRTIIFVSHNITAVKNLCTKGVLIQRGSIVTMGKIETVANKYLATLKFKKNKTEDNKIKRNIIINNIKLTNSDIYGTYQTQIQLDLASKISVKAYIAIGIDNPDFQRLVTISSKYYLKKIAIKKGKNSVICTVKGLQLKPGEYIFSIFIGNDYETYEYYDKELTLKIKSSYKYPSGYFPDNSQGSYIFNQLWETNNDKK
jgi:lipopolysaccharide transport system ATP-binding protein